MLRVKAFVILSVLGGLGFWAFCPESEPLLAFLSLDAPFRAHLCLVFIRRRDSESIPAVVAAYSGVRRVQGARPLSRLLVLDTARATGAISAPVETESRA